MKKTSMLRWASVLFVGLIASCLGFWCSVIFGKTILADGMLVVASNGAKVRVVGDSLYVLAGEADRPRTFPLFPFVAAGLYGLVVAFALRGAAA